MPALAGDGGVLFTLQELAAARDLGLSLPLVVWNNGGYGEIRDSMLRDGIEPSARTQAPSTWSRSPEGFGCDAAPAARASTTSSLSPRALDATGRR